MYFVDAWEQEASDKIPALQKRITEQQKGGRDISRSGDNVHEQSSVTSTPSLESTALTGILGSTHTAGVSG